MPLEPESDLHWKAFLYVAGELGPEEASGFECLLADDKDARDALIRAVELSEALAVVLAEPPRMPGRRSRVRFLVGAVTLAAAACLALAIVPSLMNRPAETGRPVEPDASQVAQAWSGLRSGTDADWMASIDEPRTTEPADPAQAAEVVDTETSTDRALPSWLLSAASTPRDAAPQEEN